MVHVVMGGSQDFNNLVYGQVHPGTMNFLEQQLTNISTSLTDAGKNFFSNTQQLFDQFHGSEAMRLARASVRKVSSIFQRDEIRSIWDLGKMQNAPLTMQRYIMAEPTVREMYQKQRCDGYSATYQDMYPGAIGDNHYDYRRVMDGLVVETDEGDTKCTFYFDDLVEGDRRLSLDEVIEIRSTWDFVKEMMQNGKRDPTSAFDNSL